MGLRSTVMQHATVDQAPPIKLSYTCSNWHRCFCAYETDPKRIRFCPVNTESSEAAHARRVFTGPLMPTRPFSLHTPSTLIPHLLCMRCCAGDTPRSENDNCTNPKRCAPIALDVNTANA